MNQQNEHSFCWNCWFHMKILSTVLMTSLSMSSTSFGAVWIMPGNWFRVGDGSDCINAVASVSNVSMNFDISVGIDGIFGKLDKDGKSGNWGNCIDVNMLKTFGSIVENCWNNWLKAWIKFCAIHNPLFTVSADMAWDWSAIRWTLWGYEDTVPPNISTTKMMTWTKNLVEV